MSDDDAKFSPDPQEELARFFARLRERANRSAFHGIASEPSPPESREQAVPSVIVEQSAAPDPQEELARFFARLRERANRSTFHGVASEPSPPESREQAVPFAIVEQSPAPDPGSGADDPIRPSDGGFAPPTALPLASAVVEQSPVFDQASGADDPVRSSDERFAPAVALPLREASLPPGPVALAGVTNTEPALPSQSLDQSRPQPKRVGDLGGPNLVQRAGRHRPRARASILLAGATLLLLAGAGAVLLLQSNKGTPSLIAVVDAPLITLRAPASGRLQSVSVAEGQLVPAGTVLFTIRSEAPPDPSVSELQIRMAKALTRQETVGRKLAELGGVPTTPVDPAPAAAKTNKEDQPRRDDLLQQQADVAREVALLETALAEAQASQSANVETPVIAVGAALVWSVTAQAGTELVSGVALGQVVDCTRMFLVTTSPAGAAAEFKPGEDVRVLFASSNSPAVGTISTVHAGDGVLRQHGDLVITADASAIASASHSACPIGRTAQVMRNEDRIVTQRDFRRSELAGQQKGTSSELP